jgi:hypothetical protein
MYCRCISIRAMASVTSSLALTTVILYSFAIESPAQVYA